MKVFVWHGTRKLLLLRTWWRSARLFSMRPTLNLESSYYVRFTAFCRNDDLRFTKFRISFTHTPGPISELHKSVLQPL